MHHAASQMFSVRKYNFLAKVKVFDRNVFIIRFPIYMMILLRSSLILQPAPYHQASLQSEDFNSYSGQRAVAAMSPGTIY